MVSIRLLSDLHFEFHKDGGEGFIGSLNPTGVDVLVLAGDICMARNISNIERTLHLFHEQGFEDIVFVAGNHEGYSGHVTGVDANLEQLHNDLDWLNVLIPGRVYNSYGHRFLGGTGWFPYEQSNHLYEHCMNDFRVIRGNRGGQYFYDHHEEFRRQYAVKGQPGDIVVTHHLPHPGSIHPKYKGDQLNRFFLGDMTDLIEQNKPAIWLHGHSHESADYKVGDTRIVCNPLGYPHEPNPNFDPGLTIVI